MFLFQRLDLLERYRTFAVNPFSVDIMLVVHIYYAYYALYVLVRYEAESARFLRTLVSHYYAVVHWSKLQKILAEVVFLEIMR